MTSTCNIVVTSSSFSQSPILVNELRNLGFPVKANTDGKKLEGNELSSFIGDAQVAIVGTEPITYSVLDACKNLQLIAKYGVGTDNLDQKAMAAGGIKLGWTAGVNRRSVAELVIGFLLGHFRNIFNTSQTMQAGNWIKQGGRQLSGCTIGIVGFGHTGSEVAWLLRGLGLSPQQILFHDIIDKSETAAKVGASAASFNEILAAADAISFHVPLDDTTRGMYGANQIARTRSGVLIINTARGGVVDFGETCAAVQRGHLGGFAADVYPSEPYFAAPTGPNLYFTPHIGGNSAEAVLAMGRSAISHVVEFLGR